MQVIRGASLKRGRTEPTLQDFSQWNGKFNICGKQTYQKRTEKNYLAKLREEIRLLNVNIARRSSQLRKKENGSFPALQGNDSWKLA